MRSRAEIEVFARRRVSLSRINSVEVRLPHENEAAERWSALTPTRSRAFALTLSVLRLARLWRVKPLHLD